MWRRFDPPAVPGGVRARVVDATTVQGPGNTGTDRRVHFALDLATLQCDHSEPADAHGGETFRRSPVAAGDLRLGDRGYGTAPGIPHVVGQGGHVRVRVNQQVPASHDTGGRRVSVRQRLRTPRVGRGGDWAAWVHGPDRVVPGRLVAVRLGRRAAQPARARRAWYAQKRQRRVPAAAAVLAGDVFVWADLPAGPWAATRVWDLYRLRWRIELVFQRMKSIRGLGRLPKSSDPSRRAWLHGKPFLAPLVERLPNGAERFPPADTAWVPRRGRWREVRFLYRELMTAISPRCGLAAALNRWADISRRLAEPPRRRKRQALR